MSVASKIVGVLRGLYGLAQRTSTKVFSVLTSNGTEMISVRDDATEVVLGAGSVFVSRTSPRRLVLGDTAYQLSSAEADWGLKRGAAGVVVITDGATGTGWIQNSAGRARRTTSTTNVTITPATTGLSVALAAGRTYQFKLVIYTTNVTAADGLRVDFDGGTATATAFIQNGIVTDTAGVRSLPQTTALATDVTDTTTTGAAMSVFEGTITVNTAGTFIPRFAKEADAAGATITIQAGSCLVVEDMP